MFPYFPKNFTLPNVFFPFPSEFTHFSIQHLHLSTFSKKYSLCHMYLSLFHLNCLTFPHRFVIFLYKTFMRPYFPCKPFTLPHVFFCHMYSSLFHLSSFTFPYNFLIRGQPWETVWIELCWFNQFREIRLQTRMPPGIYVIRGGGTLCGRKNAFFWCTQ